MTTNSTTSTYSCECLVNAKIPVSLFNKLEIRLRRFLQNHLPNLCNGINLEGDEVLAATIESLQITEEPSIKPSTLASNNDYNYNDNNNDKNNTSGDIDVIIEDTSSSSYDKQRQSIKVFLYKYPEESQSSTSDSTTSTSNNRTLETNINLSEDQSSSSSSSPFYSLETFPNSTCRGLWDSLEFDSNIKSSVLAYLTAIFRFSLLGLSQQNEISFNRILLLHGPPGTGKTSLAKALVSKLSTRLYFLQNSSNTFKPQSDENFNLNSSSSTNSPNPNIIYDRLQCLTIHSNQLFSRWFSESSKSVQKLFEIIREKAQIPGNFVCVLIDEIESLAMSRKQSVNSGSSEPTDSIRAVNTLLTQIDQLRSLPNILYLTTSNFPSLVDSAFLDRVDWSFEVSLPSERIIYSMLAGSARIMRQRGLIKESEDLAHSAQAAHLIGGPSLQLLSVSNSLKGQSGRAIKRLPLMAYAAFLQKHPDLQVMTVSQFIQALQDDLIKQM